MVFDAKTVFTLCSCNCSFQVYYDELLQGKTGRTDAKIRELRQK